MLLVQPLTHAPSRLGGLLPRPRSLMRGHDSAFDDLAARRVHDRLPVLVDLDAGEALDLARPRGRQLTTLRPPLKARKTC